MKLVERAEILGIGEYEPIRPAFRARVIEEKKARRFSIGARISAVFETHDSVLLQIQEMVRTERITREGAVLHEIETYNELVPREDELSVTALIEIHDKEEREAFLVRARGIESSFYVECGGERFVGVVAKDRLLEDRASAVIYLKFALSPAVAQRLRDGAVGELVIGVEHDAYRERAALAASVVLAVAADLKEPS